jgi:hypothetical protein
MSTLSGGPCGSVVGQSDAGEESAMLLKGCLDGMSCTNKRMKANFSKCAKKTNTDDRGSVSYTGSKESVKHGPAVDFSLYRCTGRTRGERSGSGYKAYSSIPCVKP